MKKNITVEIPADDPTSGGIKRMLRLAVELPHFSPVGGGVIDTINLAQMISPSVHVRFQKRTNYHPICANPWSTGLPDGHFPACDAAITYSDTPYLKELVALPQVKKTLIYMLSYGMCFERERPNILTPGVTVMCSTKKIEEAIRDDGGNPIRVGFGLTMDGFVNEHKERKNYIAILYNHMATKRYAQAVCVADMLYDDGVIDGVVTFGRTDEYNRFEKPKCLKGHYPNASKEQVKDIFNECKCYLMPSVSEGLNLTPIEATLCGCPVAMVDGAFGEIYEAGENCLRVSPDNKDMMFDAVKGIMFNFDKFSEQFEKRSRELILPYTWDKVFTNIMKLI